MPRRPATRRASCRSSIVHQVPNLAWPSCWSYNCIERPSTSCPWSTSSAAATEESTPPDIATAIRIASGRPAVGEGAEARDDRRQDVEQRGDLGGGGVTAEAQAQRVLRVVQRQPHRLQHMGGLE